MSVPQRKQTRNRGRLGRFVTDVRDSIWRHDPIPRDEKGRSEAVFNSFILHILPVKIHKHSLRLSYTLGLGMLSLYLFIILCVTGVLLMFYYVPSTTQAYQSMLELRSSVPGGTFMRNMHRWAAHGMVAIVFLHMCRVYFTGSYKPPREFNWLIGVMLLSITLFLSFTGYLLPWDQLSYWAVQVGTSIAGAIPYVGESIRYVLLGDNAIGQPTLIRFYVLHVIVLPVVAAFLIGVHFWRIRKDGGLSVPEEEQ